MRLCSLLLFCLFAGSTSAATFTVTNLNDTGTGSLRQAITDHISAGGTNSIDITVAGQIDITSTLPQITGGDLTVNGYSGGSTISGAGTHGLLFVNADSVTAAVTLNDLTLTNGMAFTGSAVQAQADNGGILTFAMNHCTVTGNTSTGFGAVLVEAADSLTLGTSVTATVNFCSFSGNTGSALRITGDSGTSLSATISSSTFSGNTGAAGGAGITLNQASTTISNCTIADNSATSGGGGIFLTGIGSTTLTNCTVTNNSAPNGGGIEFQVSSFQTLTLQNTIVAGNTAATSAPDIHVPGVNNTVTSNDGNLIGDDSGLTMTTMANDQVGTSAAPIDPLLGPLALNGGTTMTHALLAGSPAIDAGVIGGPSSDQRGMTRDATPDIGAYEFGATSPSTGGGGGSGSSDDDDDCATKTTGSPIALWLVLLAVPALVWFRRRVA